MSRDTSYFYRLKGRPTRLKPRADGQNERTLRPHKANPRLEASAYELFPVLAAIGPTAEF